MSNRQRSRMNPTVYPSADVALTCPRCDSACIRVREVHVFSRAKEGGPGARTIVDSGGSVSTVSSVDRFAGQGIGDVRVAVACEMCGETSWLNFAQHKGRAFLTWQGKQAVIARLRSEDDARGLAERLTKRFDVRAMVTEETVTEGGEAWYPYAVIVGMRGGVRGAALQDFVAGFLGGIADEGKLVVEEA
jgi:hypothetical protein